MFVTKYSLPKKNNFNATRQQWRILLRSCRKVAPSLMTTTQMTENRRKNTGKINKQTSYQKLLGALQ